MDINLVGIKIIDSHEIPKCIKIVRKYCDLSISEIKDAITNDNYVFVCDYIDEAQIKLIIALYEELCANNVSVELYEHNRVTDIDFLKNLVETYEEINQQECENNE